MQMMIEVHENPQARTYHAVNEMWSKYPQRVLFTPPFKAHAPGWDQIGEIGRRLLYPVFQGNRRHLGLALLHPEYLFLAKREEAGWEEIDLSLLEAARRIFGEVDMIEL